MTREEIDQKYSELFTSLHDEFFETINEGTSQQERRLRLDKSADELNSRYFEIQQEHETELEAGGFAPPPPEPPRSPHISTIEAIDTTKVRPVRIKRVWESRDYFYDCFVTESVKDQYLAGDVAVGDYVIVHFADIKEQIVTAKVFRSW